MDSETFLFSLAQGIQQREATHGFSHLAENERVFSLVWSLEGELNNGGFNQFFFNSAGNRAAETTNALRAIGAEHTASILEQAILVFGPSGPARDWALRQEQLNALPNDAIDALSKLDTVFLKYTDNLSALLANFMRSQ
jgi:hypothetical protein